MSAFLKLDGIKGEATDQGHKDWIIVDSMSAPIYRSVHSGAKDMERVRGETTLGDVVIVHELDKASPLIQEACAKGKFLREVEIHFCTVVNDKHEPYWKYKLKNVIVTSCSFHGIATGDPRPSEQITLSFTDVEWTYVVLDEKGKSNGNVPASYSLGQGK